MATLGITFGVLATMFVGVWIASVVLSDASLVDRFWGIGFVVVAATRLVLSMPSVRGLAVAGATALWGLRLSGYLTWRNWGHGEDRRYQKMRERGGPHFALMSLVTIYLLQAVLCFVISLPVQQAVSDGGGLGVLQIVGLSLFGFGFSLETIADTQLALFLARGEKGKVMDTGLWSWSRHPNYFGEMMLWWGLGIVALEPSVRGVACALVPPAILTFMLLRVSGVSLLESTIESRRPGYKEYAAKTSAFIPMPPKKS